MLHGQQSLSETTMFVVVNFRSGMKMFAMDVTEWNKDLKWVPSHSRDDQLRLCVGLKRRQTCKVIPIGNDFCRAEMFI